MKKLIALILIAVMCLPFASCTNNEEIEALKEQIAELEKAPEKADKMKKEILGRWLFSPENSSEVYFQFSEDFTGKVILKSDESKTESFSWSYDVTTGLYLLFMENQSAVQYAKIDADGKLAYYGQLGERVG
ncbi:MAG: hypothetical protein E7633_04110 [Ruminococcaceae bacterium]|nr:hypothetical protein [Oscillospiraceae bacterium]